jgi:hypothetical protein
VRRRHHPKPLTITSLAAANRALALLRDGQASAVKTLRAGKVLIIVRSEEPGQVWEAKVGTEYAHLFEQFLSEHGAGDGLFPGFDQTASIKPMEQIT